MDYKTILENSAYRLCDIEREFGISSSQMCGYIYRDVKPTKNKKIIEEIMEKIANSPRLIKHPSYGYATQEEIEKLKTVGIGPDRDFILKQIEKRTKNKGKGGV